MIPHPQPHKLFCAAQIRCEQCGYFNPYTCDDDSEGECWRFPHHENIDRPKAHSCAEGKLFWDDRASHSSAQSEQEIRDKVLDEVRKKYVEYNDIPCPELAEKYDHLCDAEYCGMCILDFVLAELRSKQGKQKDTGRM